MSWLLAHARVRTLLQGRAASRMQQTAQADEAGPTLLAAVPQAGRHVPLPCARMQAPKTCAASAARWCAHLGALQPDALHSGAASLHDCHKVTAGRQCHPIGVEQAVCHELRAECLRVVGQQPASRVTLLPYIPRLSCSEAPCLASAGEGQQALDACAMQSVSLVQAALPGLSECCDQSRHSRARPDSVTLLGFCRWQTACQQEPVKLCPALSETLQYLPPAHTAIRKPPLNGMHCHPLCMSVEAWRVMAER